MAAIASRAKTTPTDAQFQSALALARTDDTEGAVRMLERTYASDAKHPGVRNALGVLRLERGDFAGAIAMLKPLARELPNAASIQLNLGNALVAAGRAGDAIAPLKRATSLDATSALTWYGYARALQTAGRVPEAEPAYVQALRSAPEHAESRANLAAVYNFLDRAKEGEATARAVLRLFPSHAGAHVNLAMSLLAQRRWAEAWAEYEWREATTLLDAQRRTWTAPRWDGGAVQGMTVLVHAEQGYGDTLQFVRYLPLLRARGARVILAVPAALQSLLLASCAYATPLADDVVRLGDAMPAHDFHVPLTGLPHRLQCTSDTMVFVDDAPYLVTPSDRAGALALPAHQTSTRSLRVGLVWAGSGTHVNDMHRSCGLKALLPLSDEPGIQWVSLQAGERARDLSAWPKRVPIVDAAPLLQDFADTAATLAQLDLIVTIDSAVAHLAGALGRPCVLLLPRIGLDWRWAPAPSVSSAVEFNAALHDRSPDTSHDLSHDLSRDLSHDSKKDASGSAEHDAEFPERTLWYRSARCVRQSASGDWSSAIAQVRVLLQATVHAALQAT